MAVIDEARTYIRSRVLQPALNHPTLPIEIKRKIQNSKIWLDKFERVGDLIYYIKRFEIGTENPTYRALHSLNLLTFEDISHAFEKEFSIWANDCTRPTDFIVGNQYNSHQILIFARSYDVRSGGIFVLESNERPFAVVIKATLHGGLYNNAWLEEPLRLKYYLKSINNHFGEHFKTNATILKNQNIPILTFIRNEDIYPFTYHGIFKFKDIRRESDGSKWFDLFRDTEETALIEDSDFAQKIFAEQTYASLHTPREQRLARLAAAPKKPLPVQIISTNYKRNPDVVAEVLERAAGKCEECHNPAPFNRKSDATPYLEVHHRIPLSQDGEDTVENAIGLCPNCHRKAHFG